MSRWTTVAVVLGLWMGLRGPSVAHAAVRLVENGMSSYAIVLSKDASPSEQCAAQDLADHIRQMSGAVLQVQPEGATVPERAILIGDSAAVRSLGIAVDGAELGDDGFILKTVGARVAIAGGRLRGTMYGVYALLEKLGCRWWYPGASTIPSLKTIDIPPLDERQVPAFEYRDMLYGDMDDSEEAMLFRARNRINGGFYKSMKAQYGGTWQFDTLVHSYGRLMPAGMYFADHPEYYALANGRRTQSQPDFSNPDVVRIMADSIMRELAEHPEWRHVTIGQNDNNGYCQCDGCKALAEKYDSLGGMQLHFAKEVSKIVRQKYPDVDINVPAYRWSRKPPTGIRPDEKGVITLCSIECNFGQPLAEGYPRENEEFRDDIVGWSKLAPKLYIWDYTTNFTHYILPYPNYYVLAPNLKFFADHKVRGYMAQGSHTTNHGQMAPLSIWILARALWNPDADGKALTREFCLGYYGEEAGRLVLDYLDLLHDGIARERTPIWCTRGTYLSAPYLSPELMAKGDSLLRRAEAAAKGEPEVLKRIQADHVPILYVMIKRADTMIPAAAALTRGLTAATVGRELSEYARAANMTNVAEGGGTGAPFYDWALDYGALKARGPAADMPDEVKRLAPGTYRFLQAGQLDQRMAALKKVEGATDGWAQAVTSPGWSIQHRFAAPWDFEVGKSYRFFVRAKATADADPTADALTVGIYVRPPLPRTCSRSIKASEVNGRWQVYDVGPWKPTEEGGTFYIATGRSGVSAAYLDCMWLVEEPAGPAAP